MMTAFQQHPIFWVSLLSWTICPIVVVVIAARNRGRTIPWLAIILMGLGAWGLFPGPLTRLSFGLSIIGFLNPLWALIWWLTKGRRLRRSDDLGAAGAPVG